MRDGLQQLDRVVKEKTAITFAPFANGPALINSLWSGLKGWQCNLYILNIILKKQYTPAPHIRNIVFII